MLNIEFTITNAEIATLEQFVSVCNLQNVLHNLIRVRLRVWNFWITVREWVRVMGRIGVGFMSKICKLCMHYFKIAQHILQLAQIDKVHATQ